MKQFGCVLILLCLLGCGSNPAAPSSQDPPPGPPLHDTLNAAGDFSIFEQRGSFGNFAMWDDFTLQQNAVIRTVAWQGVYCQGRINVTTPPGPNATEFRIRVASDFQAMPAVYVSGTEPPVHDRRYPIAEVGERFEANTDPSRPCPGAFYSYLVRLNPPLSVTAGTRYWLNIVATVDTSQARWGWRVGRANNLYSRMFLGELTTHFADQAFLLDD